ncbi:MAG: PAS domain-containing protein [Verrucomicrobia bacterium]|nr:PAS domain-containing protein [Verrucomicrobiota bacterium]
MNAPIPPDETNRLAALRRYDVLDTAPEEAFDDLMQLAAHICEMPMALISLVDSDRQWFKSRLGVSAGETPRNIAFCAHTILHRDEIFEVRDARNDPRFADSPLVTGDPRICAYAGAPLVTSDGHALGALCVMDHSPRRLSEAQAAALRTLGRQVVAQLELRRRTGELQRKVAQLEASEREAERSRRALLGILEDEKLTGQNLRESEERFRQLADSIDEVFWLTDPVKSLMLYISPAYERIWGRTCASLHESPMNWAQAIHPEDRERVLSAMARQQHGGYDETYRIIRPDLAERWIHDRAFPVRNAAGEVFRIAGVAKDITEKKQLEAQFFRAQRLESIGTLASGIAHDLNNILAPIMMSAPLIRMGGADASTERMLATIESSAERGARLVQQLLTFGRGLEGKRLPIPLQPLIREMRTIVQQTFPKNITIDLRLAPQLGLVVGDATQLHQILLNLCVNARDAMPDGGQLTIAAANVAFDANQAGMIPGAKPGAYVRLSVIDTGTGMTPQIIDKIFEPFFTTKAPGKGTGLGLATTMGLVKSHGGFLTLTSEVGKGTTFHVHLPVAPEGAAQEAPAASAAVPSGHGELILLVEDEANIRDAMGEALLKHGYKVLTAGDGIEALAVYPAHANEVRLVISDLDMPNMNGANLLRVLKKMQPALPLMVSTGLAAKADGSRADELRELRPFAVLAKPYSLDQLLRTVHAALAGESA